MRCAIRRRIPFELLLCTRNKLRLLEAHQDLLMEQISKAIGFEVERTRVDTFIRLYPRDGGERAMAYDPLKLREGIEIEMVMMEYEK